jgi:hypothetical protein
MGFLKVRFVFVWYLVAVVGLATLGSVFYSDSFRSIGDPDGHGISAGFFGVIGFFCCLIHFVLTAREVRS